MPFDSLPHRRGTQALWDLSALLRDPSRWPEGHRWDYSKILSQPRRAPGCGTLCCAIGLGIAKNFIVPALGRHAGEPIFDAGVYASQLGMPPRTVHDIFSSPSFYEVKNWCEVTPTMVADAIDRWCEGSDD